MKGEQWLFTESKGEGSSLAYVPALYIKDKKYGWSFNY